MSAYSLLGTLFKFHTPYLLGPYNKPGRHVLMLFPFYRSEKNESQRIRWSALLEKLESLGWDSQHDFHI